MDEKKYNSNQDYCDAAETKQAVPSYDQYHKDHPDIPIDKIDSKRAETLYSCHDNYQMGSIQDNKIYIATTDAQHDQIYNHQHVDEHGGLSGYFSDQATIDSCKEKNGALDNTAYNEACQIAPHREGGLSGEGDATYKPHIDCFEIDRQALFDNYGTYDFNAAIAKCEANNQFGSGGGNQGYNPYISEMIDKEILKYNPDKSYSDCSISNSEYCNPNQLSNSVVRDLDYRDMMRDAQTRAQDGVNNNTPHPSSEACKNGYEHNANPIQTPTGNATEWKKGETYDKRTMDNPTGIGSQENKINPVKQEGNAEKGHSSKDGYQAVGKENLATKPQDQQGKYTAVPKNHLAKQDEVGNNLEKNPTGQCAGLNDGMKGSDKKSAGVGI